MLTPIELYERFWHENRCAPDADDTIYLMRAYHAQYEGRVSEYEIPGLDSECWEHWHSSPHLEHCEHCARAGLIGTEDDAAAACFVCATPHQIYWADTYNYLGHRVRIVVDAAELSSYDELAELIPGLV